MLGQRNETRQTLRKVYLNIKDGAVVKRTDHGEETYSYVEGRLENIYQKDRTFRNESVVYWYIDLRDDDSGELYSIGFPYGSNTFKSIVLALASPTGITAIEDGSIIRIEPYTKNGYDKIVVWVKGVKLDWVTRTLPPIVERAIGGRKIKDDTDRMNLICSYVANIERAIPALLK